MICKKCGKEIPDSSNFCKYCGTNVEENCKIKVIFQRTKKILGFAIPMKVIIDGNLVATLKNGETQEVEVTAGEHKVIIDTIGEINEQLLTFSSEYSRTYIELVMKMGLVTGKAHIASIKNEK